MKKSFSLISPHVSHTQFDNQHVFDHIGFVTRLELVYSAKTSESHISLDLFHVFKNKNLFTHLALSKPLDISSFPDEPLLPPDLLRFLTSNASTLSRSSVSIASRALHIFPTTCNLIWNSADTVFCVAPARIREIISSFLSGGGDGAAGALGILATYFCFHFCFIRIDEFN